jgi:putative alpha-1,2-mannosidase
MPVGRTRQPTSFICCWKRYSPTIAPVASLALGNGKNFMSLQETSIGTANRYVQSATLNGVDLPTSWFRHAQIRDGATLMLTMGSAPSNGGKTTPPPSMSDANFDGCPGAK